MSTNTESPTDKCGTCGHATPHQRVGPIRDLNGHAHADACEDCDCINRPACLCVCHGYQRVSGSHATKCCVFTPPEASVSSTPVQSASEECPICTSYSAMFGETCGFHGSVPVGQTSATPVPDRCACGHDHPTTKTMIGLDPFCHDCNDRCPVTPAVDQGKNDALD